VIAGSAAVAVVGFWNSLHYGLAQDAFAWIGRTRGFFPHTTGVWRTLSYDVYYWTMDACFGLQARPYRIVGLALHAANTALVMALGLRIGLSRAAAFAATMFFAVHYASFDALFAVGSISEPMATFFALLSLWLALPDRERPSDWPRALAVTVAFVAALLSKETVVLYPAVLWLATRLKPHAARSAVIPCALASAIFLVLFYLTDPVGSLRAVPGTNPYEPHWDQSLLASWATYLAWAGHLVNLHEADLHDRVGRHLEAWVATAAWIAALELLIARARRARQVDAPLRAAAIGSALYVAFIAPVLPLASHAFHLYLYLPLAGLGWVLAAVWDACVPGRARGVAWLLAAGLAIQGVITLRGIEQAPLRDTHLPFMGSVRRALTARRLLSGLSDPSAPLPEHLVLLGPDALSPPTRPDTTQLGAFLFNDILGAVNQGNGIRLRFPRVHQVDFYGDLGSALPADVAVFDYEGNVLRGPTAWLWLRRAQVEWRAGRVPSTAIALAEARKATDGWRSDLAGRWREEGLNAIRQQAEGMLAEESGVSRTPGDPRSPVREAYRRELAQVLELSR
jgi:hypothetical protein